MSSLIEAVQGLIERTYRLESGVTEIGRFVIGDRGLRRFYGSETLFERVGSRHGRARTFVRETGEGLRAAIYLPDGEIDTLEAAPPWRGLDGRNVDAFAALVEEVDHLLVVAERARQRRPVSLFELELHANVSKYLVLSRFLAGAGNRLAEKRRRWLHDRLFDGCFDLDDPEVRQRYVDAERWACRMLRGIRRLAPDARIAELRRFHRASARGKVRAIRRLAAPAA